MFKGKGILIFPESFYSSPLQKEEEESVCAHVCVSVWVCVSVGVCGGSVCVYSRI